jgi:hypothetical protein
MLQIKIDSFEKKPLKTITITNTKNIQLGNNSTSRPITPKKSLFGYVKSIFK